MKAQFTFTHGSVSEFLNRNFSDKENRTGAVATFTGIVRKDIIQKSEVTGIEFSAHEELAEEICTNLMMKFLSEYNLHQIRIIHSLGYIQTGHACFYVEIQSAHRTEAFTALAQLVDEFKAHVPIFGKELLNNNEYVWKENKY